MIKRNAIKCLRCGDIIESKHVHDFVTCSCGAISVDGGHEYLKRVIGPGVEGNDILDLSENEDGLIHKPLPGERRLRFLLKEAGVDERLID